MSHLFPLIFWLLAQLAGSLVDPFLRGLPAVAWEAPDRSPDEVGRASTYARPAKTCEPGDIKCKPRKAGSKKQSLMACAETTRVAPDMAVCAHRTHRCGTLLLLQHEGTGRTAMCRVMDRGPYGAHDAETGEWFNKAREPDREGTYAGVLDMGPAVRAVLAPGDGGKPRVRIWVLDVPRRPIKRVRVKRPTS